MKKNLVFLARAVVFLAIFGLLFAPLNELTIRKSLTGTWDMTRKVSGFFNEKEDSLEVLFLGSSHAYAAFSPLRLWEDTGVQSYVFATQRQPIWATCYYLRAALRRQSPALVVIECNTAMDSDEYYDEGVTHSYMDDLPLSPDKAALAWVSAPDLSGRAELLVPFIKYHGRWPDLEAADYDFDRRALRDPYRGYVLLSPQETERPRPAIETVTERAPLLDKNERWLRRLLDECVERGIETRLVKSPSNLSLDEKARLNTIADIAAEYGVPFHDFNEDYAAIGLTPARFYDEHHLDALGAALFTDYFAAWLADEGIALAAGADDWSADAAAYEAALAQMQP